MQKSGMGPLQSHFWEYLIRIFGAVYAALTYSLRASFEKKLYGHAQ
jgi:hypothetical protein